MQLKTLNGMLMLGRAAERAGFKPMSGKWIKEWPSGRQWRFNFDGTKPEILDQYGRLIRDESSGITTYGLIIHSLLS